jgi:hypothetical protein
MTVQLIGLEAASKSNGQSPSGMRTYKLESDTKILTNIDDVIDFSDLPAYDEAWDASTNALLKVTDKRAEYLDDKEGYYWYVRITYSPPTGQTGQEALDPRDREWLWSKSTEKNEVVTVNSLYDTSGYVYPTSSAGNMVNLGQNVAVANTAGDPPENGVVRPISRSVYSLTKYVDGPSDIVTGASSWADVNDYIDSVNSGDTTMLDVPYTKWEMYMDDITYEPHTENGYDSIRVPLTVVTDQYFKHVFSFPSAGYNQIIDDTSVEIRHPGTKEKISSPALLDSTGSPIADATAAPYIKTPVIVSAGVNQPKDWTQLTIPTSIP